MIMIMKIVIITKISIYICIIQFISSNPTAFKLSYENRKPHRRSWRFPQTARDGLHTPSLQDAVWHATSQEGQLSLYQVTRRWFTRPPTSKKREVVQGKVLRRGDVSKNCLWWLLCFFCSFFGGTLGGFPKFKACQYVWYVTKQPSRKSSNLRHLPTSRRPFPRCNKPMEIWLQSTTNVPTIISSCWRWDAQVFCVKMYPGADWIRGVLFFLRGGKKF